MHFPIQLHTMESPPVQGTLGTGDKELSGGYALVIGRR